MSTAEKAANRRAPPADRPHLRQIQGTSSQRSAFSVLRRTGPWRDALRRRMLALADGTGVLLAVVLSYRLTDGPTSHVFWAAVLLPLWLVLAKLNGLYDRDHRALRHLTTDEIPALMTWALIGTALLMAMLSLLSSAPVVTPSAVGLCVAVITVVPVLRAAVRWLWRRTVPAERVVIVGRGPLEQATRRKLELFGDMHMNIVRTIAEDELQQRGEIAVALVEAGRHDRIERIILASQTIDEHLIAELVSVARAGSIKLSVVPPARGMFGTAVRLGHVADLPLIEYSTWDVGRSTMLLKRVADVVVAAVTLCILAPLLAVIAVAIRLDSAGPSFFRQTRAGMHGAPFRILKFRTMTSDAEQRLHEVVQLDALASPSFKTENDPRITRLGRILRRTSLDELPQLLNILRGHMSLVGPRPEQIEVVDRYEDEHRFRLSVRPGLTGPMQVYGRGALRFDERLAVERDYLENYSLGRDVRILLLTASAVVGGGGAY